MNPTIKCTHCGRDIRIDDALAHELKEKTEAIKKSAEAETRKILQEEFEAKEKERLTVLDAEKAKNQKIIEALEKEKLETAQKIKEAEVKIKEAEEKIREDALKEASEKNRLEKLEFEKKINDMQKALEEAQRKAKQGSQQLQGEVLELDLEEQLKNQFPLDEFLPVPKGVEGGDIWQKVMDAQGNMAGSIIWETKRTKSWSKGWLPKLREDGRKIGASECILITQVLPEGVKSYHRIENVWVSNFEFALNTARFVRFLLLKIASTKANASHKDDDLRAIRDYITSDAFKHKFESYQEAIKALKDDLVAEKRLTEIRWRKREAYIDRLDRNSSQMYGELQGVVPELPDIDAIVLDSGEN